MPEPKWINPGPGFFLVDLSWLMSGSAVAMLLTLTGLAELGLGSLHYRPCSAKRDVGSDLHLIFEGTVCGEALQRNTRAGSHLFLLSAMQHKVALHWWMWCLMAVVNAYIFPGFSLEGGKKLKCSTVSSKECGLCAFYWHKCGLRRETCRVFLIPDTKAVLYQ